MHLGNDILEVLIHVIALFKDFSLSTSRVCFYLFCFLAVAMHGGTTSVVAKEHAAEAIQAAAIKGSLTKQLKPKKKASGVRKGHLSTKAIKEHDEWHDPGNRHQFPRVTLYTL